MGHSDYVITLRTYAREIRKHTEDDAHPAEEYLPRPERATATVHQLRA